MPNYIVHCLECGMTYFLEKPCVSCPNPECGSEWIVLSDRKAV